MLFVQFLVVFFMGFNGFLDACEKNDMNFYRDIALQVYQAESSKRVYVKKWNVMWDEVLNERKAQQAQSGQLNQSFTISSQDSASFSQDLVSGVEKSRQAKRNARKREKAKEKRLLGNFNKINSSDTSVDVGLAIVEPKRASSPLTLQCRSIIGRFKTINSNLRRKEFFAESIRPQQMDDLCCDVSEYANAGRTINNEWMIKIDEWCRIVRQDSCKQQQNSRDYNDDQRILKDLRYIKNCFRNNVDQTEA